MLVNAVCLLVKGDPVEEVLLGYKKIGFGQGKLVEIGGHLEAGETILQATRREICEELHVDVRLEDMQRVARLEFLFPAKPEWDRVVYVYLAHTWQGEPVETEEVKPQWFKRFDIPYEQMWADSAHWLPEVLGGKVIWARFIFNVDNETLVEFEIHPEKDFLWLHLRDLPYFRSMLRAVEAGYYQDFRLEQPILDVGSGDGHFAEITFDKPIDVGLDPWRDPNAHAAQYRGHRTLVQAYGAAQPFPDDHFASIISNSVLEHIEGIDVVLADSARVLKPGGWLLFCVPNERYLTELAVPKLLEKIGLKRLAAAYREWFRRMSLVYHADPPEVWHARLENVGLELVDWWHYFSPKAMRALEIGHFFGVPALVAQKLTGRWIISPTHWNLALTERYVRRFTSPRRIPNGTFSFFVARKR